VVARFARAAYSDAGDPSAAFATLVSIASLMALAFVLATRKDD
jgi:hypothetical protein